MTCLWARNRVTWWEGARAGRRKGSAPEGIERQQPGQRPSGKTQHRQPGAVPLASPPGPTCSKRLVRSAASGCPSKFMKRTEGTCGGCRASTAVRLNAGPPAGRAARDPSSLIQSALAQALQNCCRKWVSHRASMARHLGGRAHRGPGAAASACRRRPPGAAPRPRRTCAGGGGQAGGLYEPGPSSVVACAASCLQPTPLPLPPPLPAAPAARELTPASPSAGSCRAGRPTACC